MKMRTIILGIVAIGSFASVGEAKVQQRIAVVSCFIPADGPPPADYLDRKNMMYRKFRSVEYRIYHGSKIKLFGAGMAGITMRFQEPGFLKMDLPKKAKGYAKRMKKFEKVKAKGGIARKPVDPARGLKEYSFHITTAGGMSCVSAQSWFFNLRVLRGTKWTSKEAKWLDLESHAPKCSPGSSTGGPSCKHKFVLYTGIPFDKTIKAISVDALDCNQFTRRGVFVMKYGELPEVSEVKRPGMRRVDKVARWPKKEVKLPEAFGEVLEMEEE